MFGERFVGFEVRLSELDMGLSTSDDPMGIEEDMMTSKPSIFSSSKPFQALTEEGVSEGKHLKFF